MLYDFGPRLLKLRKDKNLTQQMVVERAKGFDPNLRLSDSVLEKYESDLAVPRLTEAAALADVLNVSLDYLTSGEKCNVLSLKELSPEQVQLLMDLTAYIRTKKRRSQGHKQLHLLLRHIAKNAAEGDTRCGLTTPEDFTGVRSKSACDDVN